LAGQVGTISQLRLRGNSESNTWAELASTLACPALRIVSLNLNNSVTWNTEIFISFFDVTNGVGPGILRFSEIVRAIPFAKVCHKSLSVAANTLSGTRLMRSPLSAVKELSH